MRKLLIATVPALMPALMIAGCGKAPDQTVTLTNANNVVLNDAQANYATRGDYEMANDTAGNMMGGNMAEGDNVVTANAM